MPIIPIEILNSTAVTQWESVFTRAAGFGIRVAFQGEDATRLVQSAFMPIPEVYFIADTTSLDPAIEETLASEAVAAGGSAVTRGNGMFWTRDEFVALLSNAELNIDGVGIVRQDDGDFELIDPLQFFAGLTHGTLDKAAADSFDVLNLEKHIRCFVLSSRYSMHISGSIQHAIAKNTSVWVELSNQRRGILLQEILESQHPSYAFIAMLETGVLQYAFPFLFDLAGVDEKIEKNTSGKKRYQHKDVFFHTMKVLENAAGKSPSVWFRMAALMHDIAKPATKAFSAGEGWTFHGHAEVGARMVKRMFREYDLPVERRDYVRMLVALHLRPIALVNDWVTDSAVRRLITDAGENLEDLLTLCRCDITSKNPGKVTKYLNNYDRLVDTIHEVVEKDTLREWQPPITGQEIMDICGIPAGVMVGILKTKIEDAVLSGEIENSREASLQYLYKIKDEVMAAGGSRKPPSVKQALKSLPKNLGK